MKSLVIKILILLCIIVPIHFNCSEEGETDLGGKEELLEGAWWITGYSTSDGAYFDGTGNGYDISGTYPDSLYVECDDPLTYTYDGSTFSKTEGGTTITGTFILNSDASGGTLAIGLYLFTIVKVTTYDVEGNCLD